MKPHPQPQQQNEQRKRFQLNGAWFLQMLATHGQAAALPGPPLPWLILKYHLTNTHSLFSVSSISDSQSSLFTATLRPKSQQ